MRALAAIRAAERPATTAAAIVGRAFRPRVLSVVNRWPRRRPFCCVPTTASASSPLGLSSPGPQGTTQQHNARLGTHTHTRTDIRERARTHTRTHARARRAQKGGVRKNSCRCIIYAAARRRPCCRSFSKCLFNQHAAHARTQLFVYHTHTRTRTRTHTHAEYIRNIIICPVT
ncbi:unnamed protein product [Aphis gossypii]|uniref:Uncharacterized protein n=1 Tax=Aphis gossypii TaxID=80765 RepID=A0A9P0IL30_APHGO|nr:unnamed protein product [Aphis gossypii]